MCFGKTRRCFTDAHFHTETEINIQGTDESEILKRAEEKMIEGLENYNKNGSGWMFEKKYFIGHPFSSVQTIGRVIIYPTS